MRVFLILLLILAQPAFGAIEIFDADKATLDVTISSTITFVPESNNARVSSAEAELSWIPRTTYNQRIEELAFSPEADVSEVAVFTWRNPTLTEHPITVTSLLTTNNDITPITRKPPFPLESVDAELIAYTQPSLMIDHNGDIAQLAARLAAGKDDQYEVVFALADWVTTNIEYNLSTITADAVYPSSWVLDKRYGVCDEMTNLFISLNRALGIPARFVSGIAYTNLPQLNSNWGGHGWAEVYFPDVGWVPFDTTYGEYGYVDSGHIKLKDSIDSQENSIEFTGSGYDFELKTSALDFDVDILGTSPRNYEFIEAELTAFAEEIRFGSYNLLTLRIENLREYYVSTRVELGETTQMTHESPDKKNILLKPYEEKEIHFLVRVDENLDRRYLYTFPVSAFTKLGDPAEVSFRATDNGPLYEKNAFNSFLSGKEVETADVEITCTAQNPVRKESEITCVFEGESAGLICINGECEQGLLPKEKTIIFSKEEPGVYTIPARFKDGEKEKTHFITVHVLDETKLVIKDIKLPQEVQYAEQVELTFAVERLSASTPQEAEVRVDHKYFDHEWDSQTGKYKLLFQSEQLYAGENELTISVTYVDAFGEEKQVQETVNIALTELTFTQKFALWMRALQAYIDKHVSQ